MPLKVFCVDRVRYRAGAKIGWMSRDGGAQAGVPVLLKSKRADRMPSLHGNFKTTPPTLSLR